MPGLPRLCLPVDKALALFARCAAWQTGHTRDGRPFFAIPGSQPGLFHMADARECSCPDFQRAGNLCKHVRAVRLWMAAFMTGALCSDCGGPTLHAAPEWVDMTDFYRAHFPANPA